MCPKTAPPRGRGARCDVAPPSPFPFYPQAGPFPEIKAAFRLRPGIFPGPSPPIHAILTQSLKNNCLSFARIAKQKQAEAMPSRAAARYWRRILEPSLVIVVCTVYLCEVLRRVLWLYGF